MKHLSSILSAVNQINTDFNRAATPYDICCRVKGTSTEKLLGLQSAEDVGFLERCGTGYFLTESGGEEFRRYCDQANVNPEVLVIASEVEA
jgi:hypothetical protein